VCREEVKKGLISLWCLAREFANYCRIPASVLYARVVNCSAGGNNAGDLKLDIRGKVKMNRFSEMSAL